MLVIMSIQLCAGILFSLENVQYPRNISDTTRHFTIFDVAKNVQSHGYGTAVTECIFK